MSKIKFGIGALEAARDNYKILFDRLVRGYKSVMGKDPEGLDLLKIKQEAKQRADESAKVVDMKNRTLDPSKPIMGGTQEGAANLATLNRAIDDASPGFSGDRKVDAELVAENLAERMGKVYDDLPIRERLKLYDQAYQGLTKKRFDPDGMAKGGRVGYANGSKNKKGIMMASAPSIGDDLDQLAQQLFGKPYRNLNDEEIEILQDYQSGLMAKGGLAGFAGDQRFGFKKGGMSRRNFMKIIGGLAALPVVGKFFKAAEPVAKVATKATEGVKIGLDKFMMLVDKIKRSGRPAPGRRTQDLQEVTTYKGKDGSEYELTEDLATGDLTITKDKPGGAYYGDNAFETIDDRTIMEYKKGQPDVDPDSRTAFTTADEYEEGRAIANRDGEFDDIDEVDDRVVEEILEEIKPSKIKRAGGGLAYMLGE
jgi:hypothetical protein